MELGDLATNISSARARIDTSANFCTLQYSLAFIIAHITGSMTTPRHIQLLHPHAKVPSRKHDLDAGMDCYLIEDLVLPPLGHCCVPLGIAVQIKPNQLLTVRSRSSTKMRGASCIDTTCDAGYTGQLCGFLVNHTDEQIKWSRGDRVVQLVFHQIPPSYPLKVTQSLQSTSTRQKKGFGSTGTRQ